MPFGMSVLIQVGELSIKVTLLAYPTLSQLEIALLLALTKKQ